MTKRGLITGAAAMALAATMTVSAQQSSAPPPQPAGATQTQQAGAAAQQPVPTAAAETQQIERYVVGQAKPPEVPGSKMVDLTLEQAIQIALEKNLDLQVARMNPQIQDYSLQSVKAAFSPTLTGTYNYNNRSQVNTNALDPISHAVTQTQQYNSGVTQRLPWWGSQVSVNFTNSRQASNSLITTRNPNFTSSLSFNFSQPLLLNRAIDSTRNSIRTTQAQRQVTDIQLLTTIESTKASVRNAYWALRAAIEQIQIQQLSLNLAQRLLEDNRTKVQIGTMAEIDVTTSETQEANAEQALLNAKIQWQTAELQLKRLLVSGADDDLYKETINPADQPPVFELPAIDIPGAIQKALTQRTDIVQARENLGIRKMNLEVTQNATLPQLDLSASYSSQGTGGNTLKNGTIITPGGYIDALRGIGSLNTPTWSLGLNFNYPIGMAAAHANLASAQVQLEQQQLQLKTTELTIATDITNAGLAVQNTYLLLQAARKASEAAQKNADAEKTKFDVGLSNNYNVAQAEDNLTTARLSELRAVINYVNAVAQFDLVQRVGGGGGGVTAGGGGGL